MHLAINRSRREVALALVGAFLVSLGVYWWMRNLSTGVELKPTVVVVHNLAALATIKSEDVKIIKVPGNALPKNNFVDASAVVGKLLTRNIGENEILTALDLSYNRDPGSESILVPSGLVGLVVPESWLAAPLPKVKKDDWLSLYVAAPSTNANQGGAGIVVNSAPVLAVATNKEGTPTSVLLALDGPAVERLLKARANQYVLLAVVESGAVSPSSTVWQ